MKEKEMELNVTKMTFKGFRLGYSAKHQLTPKEKVVEMQGKATTPASINLFKKFIQKHKSN
jgi:hypothetical protein